MGRVRYRDDLSDHNAVVPTWMHCDCATFEGGQGPVEQSHPGQQPRVVRDAVQLTMQRSSSGSQPVCGRSVAR